MRENKKFKRETDMSSINLTIPKMDADIVRQTLRLLERVKPLSSVEYLFELKTQGPSSNLFKATRLFIGLAESVKNQTYPVNTHETIGIGLDLIAQGGDGIALFYAMDLDRDWESLYPKMQHNDYLPDPPLSPTDIDKLFYYTLIGAKYKNYVAKGEVELLINALRRYDLSETRFEAYQLLALQSLSFNSPALIGKGLAAALKSLDETSDDNAVLEQMIYYSNRGKVLGLENRRLKEAGLFHGNPSPDQIHVYWRYYPKPGPALEADPESMRSKRSLEAMVPPHYPYSLPSGVHHLDYQGSDEVITVPGTDPEGRLRCHSFW